MKESIHNIYCADFETTSLANLNKDGYVRVYLWSLVNLERTREYYGFNIQSFISKLNELKIDKVWFHNLRFDGSFIIDYLLVMGYEYGRDFTTIIDTMNIWYEIRLKLTDNEVVIWDSLKKFPNQKVEDIAHLYGIEGKKVPPHFDRYLPLDYVPYKEEIEYCLQDSRIIAFAMFKEYENGHRGMTLSTDAFRSVQSTIGGFLGWRNKMPKLDLKTDAFIRNSYKGGWVYVNPEYQEKELNDVTIYDVNSLYPHVMRNCELPWGSPMYTENLPEDFNRDNDYLYVIRLKAEFELKTGYVPTLQVKNNPYYIPTQYVTQSIEPTELYLTNIDYDLFMEHYKVDIHKIYSCYVMPKRVGLLREYIDYWTNIKIEATKNKDYALRYIAKRYLNSPYGKTGMKLDRENKIPILEDGEVKFNVERTEGEGIYIPYASFVCAQARNITIRNAQKNYKDFVYADTDSLHLLGDKHYGIEVDDVKLGYWKIEGQYEKAKYLRAKAYIHADKNYNVQEVKCAGMPDELKDVCTWDRFKNGEVFEGKLTQKRVPGGVVLCPTTFQLQIV